MSELVEVRISWDADSKLSWRDCAAIMAAHGNVGDVHESLTVRPGGFVECGALIRLYESSSCLERPKLRDHFHLTCAHVLEPGRFSGCVHKLLSDDVCPHLRAKLVSSEPPALSII